MDYDNYFFGIKLSTVRRIWGCICHAIFALVFVGLPSISISDPDCSDKESFSDVEYLLSCNSDSERIFSLKDRVRSDVIFFKKWRMETGSRESILIKADIDSVEDKIAKAESAIQNLSHVECVFEGHPGFRPFSGSSSQNYALCVQTAQNNRMISMLESALRYMGVERPSFECDENGSEIEKIICQSDYLSGLDRRISEARENQVGDLALSVPYEKGNWIAYLSDQCSGEPKIQDCLGEVMASELREL